MVGLMVIGLLGYAYYKDLIHGPDLVETPAEISLRNVFSPVTDWSKAEIEGARLYADSLATTSAIFIHDGRLIAEGGETNKRSDVHSVRKSLVSALYGIAVEKGLIDIHRTLDELGFDDHNPPLSKQEKQATLEHLLQARSGIYHASIEDSNSERPQRGSHMPGEAFYYNNWSFNAIGIIFERLARRSLGSAFKEWIADPIGMQDFRPEDVVYMHGDESEFPAYRFRISTRDLARFSVLYAQNGRWGDQQIVPSAWVDSTFTKHSAFDDGLGYGYMWWIMPDSTYMATGTGGQKIIIDPAKKLVTITKVNTGQGLGRAYWWNFGGRINNRYVRVMRRRIAAAAPEGTF